MYINAVIEFTAIKGSLSPGVISLTALRDSAAPNSSCETISFAYLSVEQKSAILMSKVNVTATLFTIRNLMWP